MKYKATIERSETSLLKMSCKKNPVTIVNDDGVIREWVGIGWIPIGTDKEAKFKDIPKICEDTP